MRGAKECSVCGKDYLARQRHNVEDFRTVIGKLKGKHPAALLTV